MPTVIASWSHADPSPEDFDRRLRDVRALVDALRAAGVDADADLYHFDEGVDWTRWGPRLLADADFILVIVGPAWRAAWEGRADPTRSAGAAAETDVLRSIYNRDRDGFIGRVRLVLLPGSSDTDIPDGLHGVPRHVVASLDDERFEALLRDLTAQSRYQLPPLGPPRLLPPIPMPGAIGADIESYRYVSLVEAPEVRWRHQWDQQARYSRASLTIHCLPVPSRAIPARELPGLGRSLVTAVRASGLVADDIALPLDEGRSAIYVRAELPRRDHRAVVRRGAFECLLVSTETGQRSVARELPGDSMGTVVDGGAVEADLVDGLLLVARTLAGPSTIALAAEIGPPELITDGTVATLDRSSATMLKTGRGPLLVEPDEAIEVSDLARAAPAIASDFAAVIVRAWELH